MKMKSHKTDTIIMYFQNLFQDSSDIKVIRAQVVNSRIQEDLVLVYCEGLINSDLLLNSILPEIQKSYRLNGDKGLKELNSSESIKLIKDNLSVEKAIHE